MKQLRVFDWLVPATVSLGLLACYRTSPVASHMWRHYDRADDVQELVRLGEIDRARRSARWIADNPTVDEFPTGADQFVEALRVNAHRIAEADERLVAVAATAQLGRTCGSCHVAYHGGPRLQDVGDPPEISSGATQQMTRHRWAADRMWEGLVAPSEPHWRAGAQVLTRAPLYQRWLTGQWDAYEQVQLLAERIEQIGRKAADAESWEERALVYGEFLETCAACHTLIRGPGDASEGEPSSHSLGDSVEKR